MTDKQQQFTFKENIVMEGFDERALLVDMDSEKIFELNATGARVAELIIEKQSVSEIIAALNGEYEAVLSDKEADILAFLHDLLVQGLIIEDPNPNGSGG